MEETKRKRGRPRKVISETEVIQPDFSVQLARQEKAHENVKEVLAKQPHGGSLMRQRKDPVKTSYEDPLEFLQAVYRGEIDATNAQITAAKAMLPFVHKKVGEQGKKEERKEAAKEASGGKFTSTEPPKLVANGGRSL